MPHVHLIEGPVGAGKSTFAQAMSKHQRCVHIALDEWFARLYSPDRPEDNFVPWYMERKDRLIDLIWSHARGILATDTDVALELGLIRRQARQEFYEKLSGDGVDFTVHILDAPLDVRRERVRQRNATRGATFSMVVPDSIFEVASRMWEPPDEIECENATIVFVGQ